MTGHPEMTGLAPTTLSKQPAFWVFLLLVAGSLMIVGMEQVAYVSAYPAAWFLSIVLLVVTAIPAGLIIYRFDIFEPEPASLIAVALMWGGIVALSFSAIANYALMSFLQYLLPTDTVDAWGAAIVAPINEELYKGAGLVIIFLMARSEINSLMDGLVYGAMIGLGFQVVENVQYFMYAAGETGAGQVAPVISTYFIRVILAGLYSHTLFTGLMGFGLAYLWTQRSAPRYRRIAVAILFALLAWIAHFVWNSPWLDSLAGHSAGELVLALIMKGMPFLLFLVLLAIVAKRRERQVFTRLIATEVGTDVLNEAEFRILVSGRRRRRALRGVKRQRGKAARSRLKQLQREQMNLALFHDRLRSPDHPALEAQRDKIRMLKSRPTSDL